MVICLLVDDGNLFVGNGDLFVGNGDLLLDNVICFICRNYESSWPVKGWLHSAIMHGIYA